MLSLWTLAVVLHPAHVSNALNDQIIAILWMVCDFICIQHFSGLLQPTVIRNRHLSGAVYMP